MMKREYSTASGSATSSAEHSAQRWRVYLVRCADDTLYAGVTTDVDRRVRQHNGEVSGGARYTANRRPVELAWQQACSSRSLAQMMEAQVKQLSRAEKHNLIRGLLTLDAS